jgi:hypothetical protein
MCLQGLDRNLVFEAHGRRDVLVRREGQRSKDGQQVRELERLVGVHVHRCVPIWILKRITTSFNLGNLTRDENKKRTA